MTDDPGQRGPDLPVLRFVAMLKAAYDFGLDQAAVNEIALTFDPRHPNLDEVAGALAAALLTCRSLELPDAV